MIWDIPAAYLEEPACIPTFWLSSVAEVTRFLDEHVRKGSVSVIGTSAGGRPMRAVCYGKGREGRGTTTFSGALGMGGDVKAHYGPDHARKVLMVMGAVHGGEFESIVGAVNFLSVLETGRDLRGREWPELIAEASRIDRIVVVPIVNVDGRERIPLRMQPHMGMSNAAAGYFNTGCWADGTPIGWPQCKEHIPLDFSRTQFPGGYPNDAGVNIQHDDFLGARQPETQALFDLVAQERPDIVLNMHTGAPPKNYYMRMLGSFIEPGSRAMWQALYTHVHTGLAGAGLQETREVSLEADPTRIREGVYNLDTALNLHCGALCALVESPSHSFFGKNRQGEIVRQSPDTILDAHLTLFQETMAFLAERGGRCAWAESGRSR